MNLLQHTLKHYSQCDPARIALYGESIHISYAELLKEIQTLILELDKARIGLLMDNHPAWAVADLALLFAGKCCVPLPLFFSTEQLQHSIHQAELEMIISDRPLTGLYPIKSFKKVKTCGIDLYFSYLQRNDLCIKSQEHFSGKVTYTSGTTGTPKGVMLSNQCLLNKASALAERSGANAEDRVLSLMPLSTLLENIGGVYVPLLCGASATLYSSNKIGISGSSQLDPQQLLNTINEVQPSAFIIIPQLLGLLLGAYQKGYHLPNTVRFIAMGGAPISQQYLKHAQQLKLPIYEGYGLSEAGSVVALNRIEEHRIGSVGKPLRQHEVKIGHQGEILLKGNLFQGYLGEPQHNKQSYYASGDLGHFDKDGFLYVDGRKRNVIISSFGRNISPEWIEKELDAIPIIKQSLVYGEGKPFLIAILVVNEQVNSSMPHESQSQTQVLDQLLANLNQTLPDYAQIKQFIIAKQDFQISNHQLNASGRPVRQRIYADYQTAIEQCYQELFEKTA